MISKINFKQPKYIFPLVVFIPPVCPGVLRDADLRRQRGAQQTVATDRINTELPQANAEEAGDKMYEMSRRFGDEDAFTAIGAIGEEQKENEELEHGYSEDELNKLDAAEAERLRQQREMEELERSLAESRRHINSFAYGNGSGASNGGGSRSAQSGGSSAATEGYTSQDDFARDLEEIQRRSYERQKAIEADWVSVALTGMSWLRNKGLIPSPKSVRPKRSAIAPNLSSSPVIPMLRSFIR